MDVLLLSLAGLTGIDYINNKNNKNKKNKRQTWDEIQNDSVKHKNKPMINPKVFSNTMNEISKDRIENTKFIQDKEWHNNMAPYFSGQVKQNVDPNKVKTQLNNFTGNDKAFFQKQEVKSMFVPKDNTTHPIGAQVQDDKNRYNGINSMYRRNEKPEESLLVGPGLNKGYNADPSDGFHSEYRPDYKSIDQLQVNPKKTYEGRVVSGFKRAQRGVFKEMEHRLPDRYYENNPDRYFKTTGAYLKEKKQENFKLENTNRIETTREYKGISGRSDLLKSSAPEKYRNSNQISYKNDYQRNIGSQVNKEKANENFDIQETMRDITGTKTVINNRTNINQGNTILPDDKAKETIKEKYIEETRSGQIVGSTKQSEYFTDAPDETKRELIEHLTRTGVIRGNKNSKVYNLNQLDPTIKETLVEKTRTGAVMMEEKPTLHNFDKPNTTIKETLVDKTITSNLQANTTHQVYDMNPLSTTIKETLVDKTRTGAINETNAQQILPLQDEAKATIKETYVDKTRTGVISGENQASVYNLQEANETNRQYTSRSYMGGAQDIQDGGYLNENFEAKETMRQTTSDHEYFGTAESNLKQDTNRQSSQNMRTNQYREHVLKERAPTQTGVKIASGREKMSMDHRKMERRIIIRV